jgi:hypothetical protein
VQRCIRACGDSAALKKATAARILDQLEGVISWTRLTLTTRGMTGDHTSDDYHLIALFFGTLSQLDGQLGASLVFSKTAIDVVLTIHTFRLVNEVASCRTREGGHPCYVVGVLWSFIKDDDGLRSVIEQLISSRKLRKKFCEELVFKLTEHRDLSRYKGASQWARNRLNTLVMCVSRLSVHPDVEATLLQAGYLLRVREEVERLPKAIKMKDLFTVLYETLSRPRLPGQLASLIEGGCIELLADIITRADWKAKGATATDMERMLLILRTGAFTPHCLPRLRQALSPMQQQLDRRIPLEIQIAWLSLHALVGYNSRVLSALKVPEKATVICDNYFHWVRLS